MPRSKFIHAASEQCADMLHASKFRAPDPFTWLETGGKTYLLLNDLEVDRGRSRAGVDMVDSYSEVEKNLRTAGGERPSQAKVLAAWLASKNVQKIKVPEDFPYGLARDLKKQGIDSKPVRGPFFPERATKSRQAVHALENAARIAEAGMTRGIEVLRASRIRSDGTLSYEGKTLTAEILRIEMETAVLRAGGEARGDTIVACGEQACDPHNRGSGPLLANQLIILDIFPRDASTGFFGDITRTIVRGKATDEQRRLWVTCLEGQNLALDAVKPGTEGRIIHNTIKSLFADKGYATEIKNGRWQGFFHGTGHGLGLEVHEPPRFAEAVFEVGHVVTIEPGIYIPGIGGVRHEDVAVVTKSGIRLLTRLPKPFEI